MDLFFSQSLAIFWRILKLNPKLILLISFSILSVAIMELLVGRKKTGFFNDELLVQSFYFVVNVMGYNILQTIIDDNFEGKRIQWKIMGLNDSSYFFGNFMYFLMVVGTYGGLLMLLIPVFRFFVAFLAFSISCFFFFMVVSLFFQNPESGQDLLRILFVAYTMLPVVYGSDITFRYRILMFSPQYVYWRLFAFVFNTEAQQISGSYEEFQMTDFFLIGHLIGYPALFWTLRRLRPIIATESRHVSNNKKFQSPEDIEQSLLQEDSSSGLVVSNVFKIFNKTTALKDFSYHFQKGKITCILGHNGAGKSTLIKIISGMLTPTKGRVTFEGKKSFFRNQDIRLQTGYFSCDTSYDKKLTGLEHLNFMAGIKHMDRKSISEVIDFLKMREIIHTPLENLSGGQIKKIQFGMAIMCNPKLLLLDEPTNNLDIESRQDIRDLLLMFKRQSSERVIVLSTHLLEEAKSLVDDIIILSAGQILSKGSLNTLNDISNIKYTIKAYNKSEGGEEYIPKLRRVIENFSAQLCNNKIEIIEEKRKLVAMIPRECENQTQNLLNYLLRDFKERVYIFLNSCTLEDIYFETYKNIGATQKVLDKNNFAHHFNKPLLDVPTRMKIGLITHNRLKFLFINKIQMFYQASATIIMIGFLLKFFSMKIGEFSITNIAFLTLVIELILGGFYLHNMIYERKHKIRDMLFLTKITPLQYLLGKFLADCLMNALYYFTFMLVILFFSKTHVSVLINYFFGLFFWKLGFIAFSYLISLLIKTSSNINFSVIFIYIVILIMLTPISTFYVKLFGHYPRLLLAFFNPFFFIAVFNDVEYFGRFILYFKYIFGLQLIQIVLCLAFYWILETRRLNYNYRRTKMTDEEKQSTEGLFGAPPESIYSDRLQINTANVFVEDGERVMSGMRLEKKYSNNLAIRCTFKIEKAMTYGIVGENGAGKTTLCSMLNSQIQKTSGELQVGKMNEFKNLLSKNLGMCFQQDALWLELTIRDHIDLYANLKGEPSNEKIVFLLQIFDLWDHLDKPIFYLSPGLRRKLSIIISLLGKPELLMLDEATVNLDPQSRFYLKTLLNFYKEQMETTSIITTHMVNEIENTCDMFICIKEAQFWIYCKLYEVLQDFGKYILTFSKGPNFRNFENDLRQLAEIKSSCDGEFKLNIDEGRSEVDLLRFLERLSADGVISHFNIQSESLEDIYINLIKNN